MTSLSLQALGDSLSNIASALAESPAVTPAEHFDACVNAEVRRLEQAGQEQLGIAIASIKSPIGRLLTVGW